MTYLWPWKNSRLRVGWFGTGSLQWLDNIMRYFIRWATYSLEQCAFRFWHVDFCHTTTNTSHNKTWLSSQYCHTGMKSSSTRCCRLLSTLLTWLEGMNIQYNTFAVRRVGEMSVADMAAITSISRGVHESSAGRNILASIAETEYTL